MGADLSAPMFELVCNAPAVRRHVTTSVDAGPYWASDERPPSTTTHAPLLTEMGMSCCSTISVPPVTPTSVPVLFAQLNCQLNDYLP